MAFPVLHIAASSIGRTSFRSCQSLKSIPPYTLRRRGLSTVSINYSKKSGDDGDILSTMEWMEENETNSVPKLIDYVVKHGVKETKSVSNDLYNILRSDKITPYKMG